MTITLHLRVVSSALAVAVLTLGGSHPASAQDAVRDLAVSGGATPSPVLANTTLTYSLGVTAPAGGATGVTVTDILPAGVTYVSGSPNCTNNQGTVTCFLGTVGAGTSTATIVVTPTMPGTIKNVVGVIANEYDPNMTNNSAILTTTVSGTACGVTSITPNFGPAGGGQGVVISGACFTGATNVVFQSAFATPSWHVDSDTQISATTPGLPIGYGPVDVSVLKGSTTYTLPNGYTYSRWTFTDDPIVAGVTPVKAVHITEMRQYIDLLRSRVGLGGAPWQDTLVPGTTFVKAVHIQDLRTYLNDALVRLGYGTAAYTDPGLTAGDTIKKVHIDELRQRIRAVPN